jgi:hypothetical protein
MQCMDSRLPLPHSLRRRCRRACPGPKRSNRAYPWVTARTKPDGSQIIHLNYCILSNINALTETQLSLEK